MDELKVWNRAKGVSECENVMGAHWLKWAYTHRVGTVVAKTLGASPWFSRGVGLWQSSSWSARQIPAFIRNFNIKVSDFAPGPFHSFNDFFIRRLSPGARSFTKVQNEMPAFADGRYLAYSSAEADVRFPVKGKFITPAGLLGQQESAEKFSGGPMLVARLCPVDYHRFHFPDDGRIVSQYPIHGRYDSVNPVALAAKPDVFLQNERFVSILETANFGTLAYVEVGALCVGRIVQTHKTTTFQRGDEKGYFLFGASTVIVLGQRGRWMPDADLLARTSEGIETIVTLGERVALKQN